MGFVNLKQYYLYMFTVINRKITLKSSYLFYHVEIIEEAGCV